MRPLPRDVIEAWKMALLLTNPSGNGEVCLIVSILLPSVSLRQGIGFMVKARLDRVQGLAHGKCGITSRAPHRPEHTPQSSLEVR